MKFKLNPNSQNKYTSNSLIDDVLNSRGVNNTYEYRRVSNKYENDYNLLDNITKAKECLLYHIENNNKIKIIVDSDVDGFTSAAILIMYLQNQFKGITLVYQLHTEKQHGLSSDIIIEDDIKLVVVPDAGSNDVKQCKSLKDKNIDVIILDHHESNVINDYAIVVNNQLCEYPNKSLSGVGIVYKFLQALDDELWTNNAQKYLDLVALGLVSDNMDIKNMETKLYIDLGINQIKNKQFKALLKKQSYSTKGIVDIKNISFYITPLINAMIRIGKQSEKLEMFNGFLEKTEYFKYKPRSKDVIDEIIYDRVVRNCTNTKSRQDKMRDKALKEIDNIITTNKTNNNKVIIVNCEDFIHGGLTGVVAIKVAEKYNRPCILLRNRVDSSLLRGSGRNTDKNDINDFKQLLIKSGCFELAEGHKQAFGVVIDPNNITKLNKFVSKELYDVEFDGELYVADYIIPFEELDDEIFHQIYENKNLFGKGVDEPCVVITDVEISADDIMVVGKRSDNMKIIIDGIEFFKPFIKEGEEMIDTICDWDNDKTYIVDLVGRCTINSFGGEQIPQFIIEDYNIK